MPANTPKPMKISGNHSLATLTPPAGVISNGPMAPVSKRQREAASK